MLGRDLHAVGLSHEEARVELEAAGMPTPYVDAFFGFFVDGTLDESVVLPTCGRSPAGRRVPSPTGRGRTRTPSEGQAP